MWNFETWIKNMFILLIIKINIKECCDSFTLNNFVMFMFMFKPLLQSISVPNEHSG